MFSDWNRLLLGAKAALAGGGCLAVGMAIGGRSMLHHFIVKQAIIREGGRQIFPEIRATLLANHQGRVVNFATSGGVNLEGMLFSGSGGNQKTVLIFSGSHQSCEYYTAPMIQAYLEQGLDVMVFNYRSFGESERSSITQKALYRDGEAVYQFLKNQGYRDTNILLHGYSLGVSFASEIAAKRSL